MKIANIGLQSLWFHSFVICNVRIAETWHLQVIQAVVSKKKTKSPARCRIVGLHNTAHTTNSKHVRKKSEIRTQKHICCEL
jgi:hypothetical protein